MGPDHFHHFGGGHGDGFGLWALWPAVPLLILSGLFLLWWTLNTTIATPVSGVQARWRAASARHREVAAAFAAYECDPRAVIGRPALADVREPATARFVEAFAESCALATDRYPGPEAAAAFEAAAERSSRAWTAAIEAADRVRAAQFAPGERDLLEQTAQLLAVARSSEHDGERLSAYVRAAQRLAELERLCGWQLPQHAAAVLQREGRRAILAA